MTISRSNIVDRLQYAEWVVQFAENWAALPAGAIKGKARVDIVNHVRKMVISYCYWEIGLSQEQTAKIVGRKHPAIHHQLRVHNEAHQTTGNTMRQTDPVYCRDYEMFKVDLEIQTRETDIEYLQSEIKRLNQLVRILKETN
jgi:tRNA A-37 threonylcarbamoyl transferase component Bud32